LRKALSRDPGAKRNFERLSYGKKRIYTLPIEKAKTAETRQRNVEKAIAALRKRVKLE